MPICEVHSLDDSRLDPFRQLKHTNETRRTGQFVVEGHRCVRRLLASRFETLCVVASTRRRRLIDADVPPDVPYYIVDEQLAREVIGFNFHNGVMACGRIARSPTWDEVLPGAATAPALIVACPRMTDPDNLGGLIRLCAGFGVAAIMLGAGCVDPYSRRVLRVSMGAAFSLPMLQPGDLRSDLNRLRGSRGFQIAAAVLSPGALPLASAPRPGRLVLMLGNEADGLDSEDVALSDMQVMIPMAAGADSLNVTVAAGIMLHYFEHLAPGAARRAGLP